MIKRKQHSINGLWGQKAATYIATFTCSNSPFLASPSSVNSSLPPRTRTRPPVYTAILPTYHEVSTSKCFVCFHIPPTIFYGSSFYPECYNCAGSFSCAVLPFSSLVPLWYLGSSPYVTPMVVRFNAPLSVLMVTSKGPSVSSA